MLETILWTIFGFVIFLISIWRFIYYYSRRNWGHIDINNEELIEGKVVIITGSNTGIGKVTAKEMAERGATVILACRNMEATRQAIQDIRSKTHNGTLEAIPLNLASFESVRKFTSIFLTKYKQLHILINNAGILTPIRHNKKSSDGYEIHFATNHLGHFLLTNLLLETIKKTGSSRIVTLTSHISIKGEIDFEDLMGETKNYVDDINSIQFPLYANSKLANALFNKELGRRLYGSDTKCYAVCPGNVITDISRTSDLSKFARFVLPYATLFFKTPEEGAQTTLYCALSLDKDVKMRSGEMYRNCALWQNTDLPLPELSDDVASKLWLESERLVGLR